MSVYRVGAFPESIFSVFRYRIPKKGAFWEKYVNIFFSNAVFGSKKGL